MQVRDGTAVVTNGSAIVYGVYRLTLTGVTGTFTAGQTLTFTGSGAVGNTVSYADGVLSCWITSAAQPAAADVVAQSPTSAGGTVSGVAFAPAWTTGGIAPGAIFTRQRSGVTYDVDSAQLPGKLTLAAPYAGATELGASFSITTSFTPGAGIAYVDDGDVDFAAISRRAALRIDQLLTAVLGVGLDGSLSGNALRSVRVRADENALELFEALDRLAGGTVSGALSLASTLGVAGLLTAAGGIAAEAVRLVGAPSQPAFESGWGNHGDTVTLRYPAGFWKQADGTVHLRGCVTKAALPDAETIFTLPAGYRPARLLVFSASDAIASLVSLAVAASGAISKVAGPTASAFLLLDGISFRAEQ